MSAPDSRAPDAALRQRVRDVLISYDAWHPQCDPNYKLEAKVDAVLAAIPEPTPTPEPRRVELRDGCYAVWDGVQFVVWCKRTPAYAKTAVAVASLYADVSEMDAKHAELIALRAEEVKPWGWASDYKDGQRGYLYDTEEAARTAAERGVPVVPLYRTPPAATPSAPREVLAWVNIYNDCTDSFDTEHWARRSADEARELGTTALEIAVPLVRQSPAGKP